jgi:hypothetical protein
VIEDARKIFFMDPEDELYVFCNFCLENTSGKYLGLYYLRDDYVGALSVCYKCYGKYIGLDQRNAEEEAKLCTICSSECHNDAFLINLRSYHRECFEKELKIQLNLNSEDSKFYLIRKEI